MAFTPNSITQARYLTDVKTNVVRWLEYHLEDGDGDEGYAAQWAEVGAGVDVFVGYPALPPEDAGLPKPRIAVQDNGEETVGTQNTVGQYIQSCAFHSITLTLSVVCDEGTGGPMTADDLRSAIGSCFRAYGAELEAVGIKMLRFRGTPPEPSDEGLIEFRAEIECDVQVQGAQLRTVILEMARFTITAFGVGIYSDGHELTQAQGLQLKCITGFRAFDTVVTVYAKNQDGDASTLTGTIPNGASAGTVVALVPAVEGDTFTDVTSITITGGVAGEVFTVQNISEEV